MSAQWIHSLEAQLHVRVIRHSSVGGGCIANAMRVSLDDGRTLFVKTMSSSQSPFLQEAHGLEALAQTQTLRIPEVLLATPQLLALELISEAPRAADFMEQLGRGLADMHRHQHSHFGFWEDNFIGASPQSNAPQLSITHWPAFYWQHRLLFQLHLAEQNGLATAELQKLLQRLESRLESLLSGSEEPPALIHGDLWSGNVIADEAGKPCLIDPAVYYGHREAELGMTHLFGGFSQRFYDAYQEQYPLPPGYPQRIGLYKLYHVLNHLNLFGHSYYSQAISLLKQYT